MTYEPVTAGPGNVAVNKPLLSRGPQVRVLSPWDLPFGFSDVTAQQVGDKRRRIKLKGALLSCWALSSPGVGSWVETPEWLRSTGVCLTCLGACHLFLPDTEDRDV